MLGSDSIVGGMDPGLRMPHAVQSILSIVDTALSWNVTSTSIVLPIFLFHD